jgi:hypothetical protein
MAAEELPACTFAEEQPACTAAEEQRSCQPVQPPEEKRAASLH